MPTQAVYDWMEKLRIQSREYVAETRREKGLPPWDWENMCCSSKSPKKVEEEAPMASDSGQTTITKVCECGCKQSFQTTVPMPNHKYIRGHKPENEKVAVRKPQPIVEIPKPSGHGVILDAQQSYVVARANMEREIKLIEAQMDCQDDELEKLRLAITKLEAAKAERCDRHEFLTVCMAAMNDLMGVKNFRNPESREAAAEQLEEAVTAVETLVPSIEPMPVLDGPPDGYYKAAQSYVDSVRRRAMDFPEGFWLDPNGEVWLPKPGVLEARRLADAEGRRPGLKDASEFDRMFMPEAQPCGGLPIQTNE